MKDLFARMQFAPVNIAVTGDSPVIPGVPGKRIRVMNYVLGAGVWCLQVQWKSNSTPISGPVLVYAEGQHPMSAELGMMETAKGEPLVLNVNWGTNPPTPLVGGHIGYILIEG